MVREADVAKKRESYSERARQRLDEIRSVFVAEDTSTLSYAQLLTKIRKLSQPAYRKGRGKAKGKGFEREVGKVIGEWWRGKAFRPTPQSGGWDKLAHDDEHIAYGDLYIPKDVDFPWSVECKKQEGWELTDLINPDRSCVIHDWWKQCAGDAYEVRKNPLLVFSRNNLGFMLVASLRALLISKELSNVPHVTFSFEDTEEERTAHKSVDVCILSFEDFKRVSSLQPPLRSVRTPVT